jgi:hypothetical protein
MGLHIFLRSWVAVAVEKNVGIQVQDGLQGIVYPFLNSILNPTSLCVKLGMILPMPRTNQNHRQNDQNPGDYQLKTYAKEKKISITLFLSKSKPKINIALLFSGKGYFHPGD